MRRLLLAALLLAAGCLAPQDIREAEPADTGNHPPRIPPDKAYVAGRAVSHLVTQTGCLEVPFELAELEDPDVEDVLEVRWFVDYDRDDRAIQGRHELGPEGREVRLAGARFTLDFDRLREARTYLVEAWLSDGFVPEDADPPDETNRAVLEGRAADRVMWLIDVEEGTCLN